MASGRSLVVATQTLTMFVVLLAGMPYFRFRPGGIARWRAVSLQRWARMSARAIGMRTSVSGPIPQAPFLLVANHLSYVDIILLGSCLECTFVAKADVRKWPGINLLCRSAGTIFVDRRPGKGISEVNRLVGEALERGSGVVIFPEATSTMGDRVKPFKPALLEPAVRAGLAVHYASLSYSTPPCEPPAEWSVCWWGDMTLVDHLFRMLRLTEFQATVEFGPRPLSGNDRKELAEKLWAGVCALFKPVVKTEDECQAKIS